MDAEHERGDRCAHLRTGSAPSGLCAIGDRGGQKAPSHEVEEGRVDGVQQQIHEVIAPGAHPAQDPVEAPGETRQRDVVAEGHAGEGPADLLEGEPAIRGILEEVHVVVPVEEGPGQGGQEGHRGQDGDGGRDQPAAHA
jgi:hypothetical protein